MNQATYSPNISKRALATLIDYCVYLPFWFYYMYQFGVSDGSGGYTVRGWLTLPLLLSWLLYFPLIESLNGQTLGHKIVGLRVVRQNGKPVTFVQSLKRRILDGFELIGTLGLIAFITVKNSDKHQRVGDIWAKTIVIEEKSANCQYCGEKLGLTHQESVTKVFDCPECGQKNDLWSKVTS